MPSLNHNWEGLELSSTETGLRRYRVIRSGRFVRISAESPSGIIESDQLAHKSPERAHADFASKVNTHNDEYGYEIIHADFDHLSKLPRPKRIEALFVERWRTQTMAGLGFRPRRWVLFDDLFINRDRNLSAEFIIDYARATSSYIDPQSDIVVTPAADLKKLRRAPFNFYDLGPIHSDDNEILDLVVASVVPNLKSGYDLVKATDAARRLTRHHATKV